MAIQDPFLRINQTGCVTLLDASKRIHCLLQQGNLEAVSVSPNLKSSEGLGVWGAYAHRVAGKADSSA